MINSGDQVSLTQTLWPQLCHYAMGACADAPERAEKRALGMFKGMTGQWPMHTSFSKTKRVKPTRETMNLIRRNQIAFSKRAG